MIVYPALYADFLLSVGMTTVPVDREVFAVAAQTSVDTLSSRGFVTA